MTPNRADCAGCRHLQTYGCPCMPPTCRLRAEPGGPGCRREALEPAPGSASVRVVGERDV